MSARLLKKELQGLVTLPSRGKKSPMCPSLYLLIYRFPLWILIGRRITRYGMARNSKSGTPSNKIQGSFCKGFFSFVVWDAENQVLYHHSVSSCLHLRTLGSHIDVQRERSQGKWIGKVLTFIAKSLCSVECMENIFLQPQPWCLFLASHL